MCGIAGALLVRGNQVSESMLNAMGRTQQHRGPDNFAIFRQGNFGCTHNRLSILDLSAAGNQPFCNERYVLVYNGEIYNYLVLKETLTELGIEVRGTSDTAVLFAYLIHFGVKETLKAIKGMFAFSFFDVQEQVLYLCRDRLGIKPLVWTHHATGLYWASEVKALKTAVSIQLDPIKTLFSATGLGDHSNEYTIFADVWQVPPGSYLECRPEQPPQTIEYYNILHDIDASYYHELSQMSRAAVTDRFLGILKRSVKGMLMSDAPMGTFVSGGIDSNLIALLAAQHDPQLALFTANVVGKYSEMADVELLNQTLKHPLHEARFHSEMMVREWARVTYHYEVPLITHTNAIPFSVVAALACKTGVKAVLTGEGSDELFQGYPEGLVRRYKKAASAPVNWLKAVYGVVPGLKGYLFPESNGSVTGFLNLSTQGFERQRLREQGYQAYSFLPKKEIPNHYLTIRMIREGLVALLHRNDRMGMIASIESRFPFLDEEMIRFAVNLPLKWKSKWSLRPHNFKHPFLIDKAIVRQAAQSALPHKLVYKNKNGFPMYGHRHIRTKPGYFANGYVAELLKLTPTAEAYMIRTQSPYYLAKLVSVDIFGRLFEFEESPEQITEHLMNHVTMTVE
ncbi:MAG: asparagine synthase (glutamine-hydrolyzing) [Chloroflexi bacterium]|nr:MAG: asparagine synthase (glutamine-hydrolyzing) [Chloroflexota bacterium]